MKKNRNAAKRFCVTLFAIQFCVRETTTLGIPECVAGRNGSGERWNRTGEIRNRTQVTANGTRRVIATLEFLQHHLA